MSWQNHICPYCESGILEEDFYSDWVIVGNISLYVHHLCVGVCGSCGSEFVTGEMHDYNLNIIYDTLEEYDTAREI